MISPECSYLIAPLYFCWPLFKQLFCLARWSSGVYSIFHSVDPVPKGKSSTTSSLETVSNNTSADHPALIRTGVTHGPFTSYRPHIQTHQNSNLLPNLIKFESFCPWEAALKFLNPIAATAISSNKNSVVYQKQIKHYYYLIITLGYVYKHIKLAVNHAQKYL